MTDLHSYDLHDLRVLIVDENKHMRQVISSILHALGVNFIGKAESGEEALKEVLGACPDVILTGRMVQPIDGVELTRRLRAHKDKYINMMPIIMVTSYTEDVFVKEARDAGVDEFLAKPISPKAMYSRLIAIVEHRRDFVKTGDFLGPDRRRKKTSKNLHRRNSDEADEADETDE